MLAVQSAVHVRDGVPRDEVGSDHLVEAIRGRAELPEPDSRRECGKEHRHDQRYDEDDGQRPPREAGVALVVGRLRDGVCPGEKDEVPPAGDRLIYLHLFVVWVVDYIHILVPGIEGLEERFDVLPVPEEDVGKRSA